MRKRFIINLTAGAILAAILLPSSRPVQAGPSSQHYIYTCADYSYNDTTGRYTLPGDCKADPYLAPATHTWITQRIPQILAGDHKKARRNYLNHLTMAGRGHGTKTRLENLVAGTIEADTKLHGCTATARAAGWPIGDHLLNPYRHFGIWSYYRHQKPGWQGVRYAASQQRRTGPCASAPRVRTSAASMGTEFYNRAAKHFQAGRDGDAMYNLGIALHTLQDASVPSHAHPEVELATFRLKNFRGHRVRGQDVFPAWANVHKTASAIDSGGRYQLPRTINKVPLNQSAKGYVYAAAATAFPYFPYDPRTAAVARTTYRCDVTNFPRQCPGESVWLLKESQRLSAGLVNLFLSRNGI